MRPGPSIEVLNGDLATGFRVDVFRAGRVIATDIPAVSVKLSVSGDRDVTEQLTYESPVSWTPEAPLDPLNSFGQQSRVTWIGERNGARHEVELGFFTHGSKSSAGWQVNGDKVQVTAYGVLQLASDNDLAWPFSPRKNDRLRHVISQIVGLPVILDGVTDAVVDRKIQFGTSRLENLAGICEAHNLGFAVKPDGYLHVWSLADTRPDVTYTFSDLLLSYEAVGQPRRPNRFIAVGTGDKDKKFTAQGGFTDPPFDSGYGTVTERIDVSSGASQRAVQAVVNERMRARFITSETRSVEIVPDPRLELGDIANFWTVEGEFFTGRVIAYELSADSSERVDVEVLQW